MSWGEQPPEQDHPAPSDQRLARGRGPASVVVIDDHPVARRGTVVELAERGIDVLAALGDPATLERVLAEALGRQPSEQAGVIIVLDPTSTERGAAFAAISGCLRLHPGCPILAFTSDISPPIVEALLDAGCSGIVPKSASADALVEAIDALMSGERHLHPRALAALLQRRQGNDVVRSIRALSARELAVLREVAEGRSNADIAVALDVSEATVKTHVAHILRKLHAEDRAHAVSRGLRLGLFE